MHKTDFGSLAARFVRRRSRCRKISPLSLATHRDGHVIDADSCRHQSLTAASSAFGRYLPRSPPFLTWRQFGEAEEVERGTVCIRVGR